MTINALTSNVTAFAGVGADFTSLLQADPLKDKKAERERLINSLKPQGNENDLNGNEIGRIKDRIAVLNKEIAELEAIPKCVVPAGSNLPGHTEKKGGNTFYYDN